MITRENHKLIGKVRKVEAEFAVFEIVDEKVVETRHQSAGYSVYDLEGKLIEEVSPHRLMMEDVYKDIYIYDSEGKLFQRDEYDENEELIGKTMFEQDDNGNRIEKHYYLDKNQILKLGSRSIYRSESKFDDGFFDDNLIERVSYDENEEILPNRIYQADSTRKDRKDIVFNDDGYTLEEFRYNEHDEFYHRISTVYDLKGNRKEYFCYEPDGTLYLKDEFTYEYDLVGNWIKQIQHHWVIGWGEFRLIPLLVIRRSIDYY